MKKLAIASILVFVIGTVAAVLFVGDGVGTVVDAYTFYDAQSHMHYFFTVRITKKSLRTSEVTEAAYDAHGCGDVFNPAWELH